MCPSRGWCWLCGSCCLSASSSVCMPPIFLDMIWPNYNRHVLAVISWTDLYNAMPALELGPNEINIFSNETSFMFHKSLSNRLPASVGRSSHRLSWSVRMVSFAITSNSRSWDRLRDHSKIVRWFNLWERFFGSYAYQFRWFSCLPSITI